MGETTDVTILEVLLIGMIGMFIMSMAVVIFFVVYQQRLLKQTAQHRQLESNYHKDLLHASIKSQENERNRIAKDLHDEIGALLTTSKLYLGQLAPGTKDEDLTRLTRKMNELLEEMIRSVRRISRDLKPVVLENFGIAEALESMAQDLNETGQTTMTVVHDLHIPMKKDLELELYRIVQELVNNTLKHAGASEIDVQLYASTRGNILLSYKDNGCGFSKKEWGKQVGTGLGLKNIESRINVINGALHFNPAPTGVDIKITVEQES